VYISSHGSKAQFGGSSLTCAGSPPQSRERLLLAGTVVLAALAFVVATRHMSHSLWFDESQTVVVASQSTVSDVATVAMQLRGYPPLFFMVVRHSLHYRSDEAGLRLPAAFFGALSIIAVFLLGKALADGFTGLLAAFLFVLTPGVFRYFVDGNAYTLLILEVTLSNLFLVRAIRSDKIADWLGYALFALLGLASHTIFVLYFVAQVLAALYSRAFARPPARAPYRRFLAVVAVLCLIEILWVVFYFHHGGDRRPFQLSRLPEISTLLVTAGMYAGPLSFGSPIQLAFWVPLQLLGGIAMFVQRRKVFWFIAIFATLSLAAITLFFRATLSYVAYKYGLGVFPLACILAAYSLRLPGAGARGLKLSWPLAAKVCGITLIASYCIAGAAFLATADARAFEYQDWKGTAQYLRNHATGSDLIALSGRYGVPCLSYYYNGPARFVSVREQHPDDLVSGLLAGPGPPDRAVWIVLLSLANENPVVARYTEFKKYDLEAQTETTIAGLRKRGLFACHAARFHRVNVIFVSRGLGQGALPSRAGGCAGMVLQPAGRGLEPPPGSQH